MQVIFGSYNGSTGVDNFCAIGFGSSVDTTEANVQMPCPAAGTFQNLRIVLSAAPGGIPSGAGFRNFFLRINGVDSALTCAFGTADSDLRDVTHTVTVSRGDVITLHDHAGGFAGATQVYFTLEFTPTTDGQSVYGGNSPGIGAQPGDPHNALFFPHVWTNGTGYQLSPGQCDIVPIAGALTGLNYVLQSAPGAGKSITLTVFKNGFPTAASVTNSDAATTGSWTGRINLAVGDLIHQEATFVGSQTTSNTAWGAQFTAAVPNQWMIGTSVIGLPSNAVANYATPNHGDAAYTTTEANTILLGPVTPSTLVGLIVTISEAPGGASWQIATRRNASTPSGSPTVTLSGSNVLGGDTAHSLALTSADTWAWQSTPAGTPNNSNISIAWAWAGATGALPPPSNFITAPVPLTPQAPCNPKAQITGGGKGKGGCNVGGVGWSRPEGIR